MPPSIAIASPVLGGPGTMRALCCVEQHQQPVFLDRGPRAWGSGERARLCFTGKVFISTPRTPDRFTGKVFISTPEDTGPFHSSNSRSQYVLVSTQRVRFDTERAKRTLSLSTVCALPFMAQLPHGWSSRRPRSPAPAHDIGLLWPIPDPPMQPNLAAMPQDHGRIQVEGE